VRGDRGYIVAAPSLHASGKKYAWEPSCSPTQTKLARIPEWLLKKLSTKKSPSKKTATANGEIIPEGERNDTLTSIGGTMRSHGKERKEILAALKRENKRRCDPPLPAGEVESIADSVSQYKKGNATKARRLVCFERDLILSRAYSELSGKAHHLLSLLYARRQVEEGRIVNNKEIMLTYAEAEKKHGISKDQFTRARDQLVEKGFINIMKDTCPALYEISNRWRKYGTPEFKKRTRKKSKNHGKRFITRQERKKRRKEKMDIIEAAKKSRV